MFVLINIYNVNTELEQPETLSVLIQFVIFKPLSYWLYVIIMSRTRLRGNLRSVVCLNGEELLARSRRHIWSLSNCNGIQTHNHLVCKRTLNLWLMVECSFENEVVVSSNLVVQIPNSVTKLLFRRKNTIWRKGLVCKSYSAVSNLVIQQTRWYNKRILRKGYSVPQDFSWIFKLSKYFGQSKN